MLTGRSSPGIGRVLWEGKKLTGAISVCFMVFISIIVKGYSEAFRFTSFGRRPPVDDIRKLFPGIGK